MCSSLLMGFTLPIVCTIYIDYIMSDFIDLKTSGLGENKNQQDGFFFSSSILPATPCIPDRRAH